MSKRSNMLRLQFGLTAVVVTANIALMILAWVLFPPDAHGQGTLRLGDCSEIRNVNSALHLVINVMSSLLLGAGNYCMQVLVAPSREEMDRAHSRGRSLDIGVPSMRNLRYIKWQKTVIWFILCLLSTILHLV